MVHEGWIASENRGAFSDLKSRSSFPKGKVLRPITQPHNEDLYLSFSLTNRKPSKRNSTHPRMASGKRFYLAIQADEILELSGQESGVVSCFDKIPQGPLLA